MECEIKLEGFVSFDVEFGKEEIEESKKCKCKFYWLGIGGFMVWQWKFYICVKRGFVV